VGFVHTVLIEAETGIETPECATERGRRQLEGQAKSVAADLRSAEGRRVPRQRAVGRRARLLVRESGSTSCLRLVGGNYFQRRLLMSTCPLPSSPNPHVHRANQTRP
jgi:hypothetical protein